MKTRTAVVDLSKICPAAWALMWKYAEKQQEEGAYRAQDYLTATDLEAGVRALAKATLEGKAWDEVKSDDVFFGYSYGIRISTGCRGSLLDACRDWLFAAVNDGRLVSHNFGRGHISGARFRPAGGAVLNETETKTLKAKAARRSTPRPRHYSPTYGHPLCIPRPKSGHFFRPSKALTVSDWEHVTCPRCLKLRKD
jgi:hypothetical protein